MSCMKTGLNFTIIGREPEGTYVGDMYHIQDNGYFLIRGIPPGTNNRSPDMVLQICGDTYQMVEMSEDFEAFWLKWNPSVSMPEGCDIIISDSRF